MSRSGEKSREEMESLGREGGRESMMACRHGYTWLYLRERPGEGDRRPKGASPEILLNSSSLAMGRPGSPGPSGRMFSLPSSWCRGAVRYNSCRHLHCVEAGGGLLVAELAAAPVLDEVPARPPALHCTQHLARGSLLHPGG